MKLVPAADGILPALLTLSLASGLYPAAPATAQRPSQGQVAYRVTDVDARSWIVSARNLETGHEVKFRLNPQAFIRKTFHADLAGRHAGEGFSVTAPKGEPLAGCCEMAQGAGGGPPEPGTRIGTGAATRPEAGASRSPGGPSFGRPTPPGPGGSSTAGGGWEIASVDRQGWVITARERSGGRTVRFRVDPQSFIGYEFRADVHDLRQGQGFGLVGVNAVPLSKCCTLLGE